MPMPQGNTQQFAGGAADLFPEKMDQFSPPILQQQQLPPQSMIEQGAQEQSLPPQPEMPTLGQTQQAAVMQEQPISEISQQTTNDGAITELPENAKNYNANSVVETTLTDNGFKVTTDAREKANNLAKDVKNFGLWEYSADNTAPSTDQTAKILQNKLDEADAFLKGKDSASLNANQVDNAQGNKVDEILNLFNKENDGQSLDDIHSDGKGLEALETEAKGFTGLGVGEKSLDLLGNGKNTDGQLGENDATILHDVGAMENSLGNQRAPVGNDGGSHEGVSVVTIPNTFSVEDEHGNKLDAENAGIRGNHKSEKQKAIQILKKLLKNKLETQALKMLLRQKKLKAALRPSVSPTQGLKEQLSVLVNHRNQGNSNGYIGSKKEPSISKMDVKLLHFIKSMLRKGIKPRKNKGISEDQLKLFMSALKVMNRNNKSLEEDEEKTEGETAEKEDRKEKEDGKGNEGDKEKEADKEKETDKDKEGKDQKNKTNAENQNEGKKEDKEKAKDEKLSDSETKGKEEKETEDAKKKTRARKLKDIQLLLEHVKPTSRSSHSFFLDEDQPLSESEGMNSNSLMKYLEHETALLDQFQEGSQISDPALQLKQLAGLMLKVANKAQAKDEYVDARRTTVRPTEDGNGDDAEKFDHDDKEKGSKTEKEFQEDGNDKKGKEKGSGKGQNEDAKEVKTDESTGKVTAKIIEKENGAKEGKSNEENEKDKQENNDNALKGIKEKKEESIGNIESKNSKDIANTNKESKNDEKDNNTEKIAKVNKERKGEENKLDEKTSKMEKQEDNESSKGKESTEGRSDRSDKVKELKNIPEVDGLRGNEKPIEKVDKGDANESQSSKMKNNEGKNDNDEFVSQKGKKEEGKGIKNEEEKVKKLKAVPEVNKLRHNKKIVNKIDGNVDKETANFKAANENTADEEKSQASSEEEGKSSTTEGGDVATGGDGSDEKADKQQHNTKVKGKGKGDVKGGSRQDATDEFHLYVSSKNNNSLISENLSHGVEKKIKGGQMLTPQLPFLNPGSAHLDVLENDASLKQYLMEKGDKNGILRKVKSEAGQKVQGSDPESFDNKESDRLLQLKDVTTKGYSPKNAKPNANRNIDSEIKINEPKEKPNAVPPAGQGIPLNGFKGGHSIKPMSRLQLQKYHKLIKYKQLMSERNRLKMSRGTAEGGALRHIAPVLADRLVDAPSVRLAALARLIALTKHRQKIIDVTASKKTLPGLLPIRPSQISQNNAKSVSPTMTPSNTSPETPKANFISNGTSSERSVAVIPSQMGQLSTMTISKVPIAYNSQVHPSSVLVPSSKQVIIPSFASTSTHDTEAHPAVESSKLLSKTAAAEHYNLIDASDVTRSQLSKPDRPSITQVMNLLGNQNGQSGSKRNTADAKENNQAKVIGHEENSKKLTGQILKNFYKQPTQPATNIRASFTNLGKLLTETGKTPTQGVSKEKGPVESNLIVRGKINTGAESVVATHDEEVGISSIRKQTARNIIRTLKTDTGAADLLLRKRNEIPRVKRRLKKGKKKFTAGHS